MHLLPGWGDRLAQNAAKVLPEQARLAPPLSPSYYASRTTFVATAEEAATMADLANQRPVGWVGFDTEFQYTRPGVLISKKKTAYDPRSVRPLLLSLAFAAPGDGGKIFCFVVDVRNPEVLPAVRNVLSLPCPFVGHFAQAELICLWQLGLGEPRVVWDTWVVEVAMNLGRHHKNYKVRPGGDEVDEARAAEEAEEEDEFRYTLVSTCLRHGVEYLHAGDKKRLQKSFLEHPDGAPFTREQIAYAAADAVAAARVYLPQVVAVAEVGLSRHLETVEMPWVTTNARMHWAGLRRDEEKCRQARAACDRHWVELEPRLREAGVPNVRSPKQLKVFFGRHDLLPLFRKGMKYSFDKKLLAAYHHRHPDIALIRSARRVLDLKQERLLTGEFDGVDGRIHPEYKHLGAHTGRQTSRWPNVLGLGKVFRPLVVPEPGYGIGEADLSQIEVGFAGAVYGDEQLIEMFNSGDVYAAMAQHYHHERLDEADRRLDSRSFRRKHKPLRDEMKAYTLGIIFGLTAHGLALQLGISVPLAKALLERFMRMFPTLVRARAEASAWGTIRGYVATATGLRRHRADASALPTNWEQNWMTNHPVQGSAATVFKAAGNRLDRLYPRYDARLLIALHDAYVFEAPLPVLKRVAVLTQRVMCETVSEYFPVLRPRAEINIEQPECWNKDGHSDSIDHWMGDPTFTL